MIIKPVNVLAATSAQQIQTKHVRPVQPPVKHATGQRQQIA